MWAGSPAAFKRKISPEDWKVFARTAERYAEFGQEYRAEGIGVGVV